MATTVEYGLGEHTFPRGWFMVAESTEATRKPEALRFFGRDWVMYRGESGRVVVMDAYCPHMKTHMGKNTTSYVVLDGEHVVGDDIRCPYHGWKFGPDGKCNEIPYSPAPIPKKACVQTLPVREWGGIILAWWDEEGGAPHFEPPALPEWEDASWVNWKIDHLGVLPCHPQEIVDNITDKGHLAPIHGSTNMELFETIFDGHVARQKLAAGHRTLADAVMTNDTWYTGPGILMSRMHGFHESLMLITHTPVEDGTTRAWHALLVKAPNTPPTQADIVTAREYQEGSRLAFAQDFEVWSTKAPCIQVLQVVGDGHFNKARTWYKQFFNPRKAAKKYQSAVNGHYVMKGTERDPWDKQAAE